MKRFCVFAVAFFALAIVSGCGGDGDGLATQGTSGGPTTDNPFFSGGSSDSGSGDGGSSGSGSASGSGSSSGYGNGSSYTTTKKVKIKNKGYVFSSSCTVNSDCPQYVTAEGGSSGSYTWSVTGLPSDLKYAATTTSKLSITGKVATAGTYSIAVSVCDASDGTDCDSTTESLTVMSALPVADLSILAIMPLLATATVVQGNGVISLSDKSAETYKTSGVGLGVSSENGGTSVDLKVPSGEVVVGANVWVGDKGGSKIVTGLQLLSCKWTEIVGSSCSKLSWPSPSIPLPGENKIAGKAEGEKIYLSFSPVASDNLSKPFVFTGVQVKRNLYIDNIRFIRNKVITATGLDHSFDNVTSLAGRYGGEVWEEDHCKTNEVLTGVKVYVDDGDAIAGLDLYCTLLSNATNPSKRVFQVTKSVPQKDSGKCVLECSGEQDIPIGFEYGMTDWDENGNDWIASLRLLCADVMAIADYGVNGKGIRAGGVRNSSNTCGNSDKAVSITKYLIPKGTGLRSLRRYTGSHLDSILPDVVAIADLPISTSPYINYSDNHLPLDMVVGNEGGEFNSNPYSHYCKGADEVITAITFSKTENEVDNIASVTCGTVGK